MRFPVEGQRFFGFFPPYRTLETLSRPDEIPTSPYPMRGSALLWNLGESDWASHLPSVKRRPPGLALIILLPPARMVGSRDRVSHLTDQARPHSVLPFIEEVDPEELAAVLRRFPPEFAFEVTDYLIWRGLDVDLDTRRLIRKTLDLSAEIRTVAGLARAFYMSRRALGRRFLQRGLPVPSHWLHFGRVLRASIRLQNPAANVFAVGCELGYPDGFALSNQMKRLTGLRPSMMRECLGWEWIVETWLAHEAENGSLAPALGDSLFPARAARTRRDAECSALESQGDLRVAEQKQWRSGDRP